ncbi:MAG: M15 family metallopeptidase, partial [Hyphomicrobium sp.]
MAIAPAHAKDPTRGFVEVKTLIPDLVVEMRYATARNFIGRPIPGYNAPRCFLTLPAAKALQCAADGLRTRGFAIKVY